MGKDMIHSRDFDEVVQMIAVAKTAYVLDGQYNAGRTVLAGWGIYP